MSTVCDTCAKGQANSTTWLAILRTAATNGHVNCLAAAHVASSLPWTYSGVGMIAAAGGHLDCLAYAHEHGGADELECTAAAGNGHLECLVYAHEHGVEFDGEEDKAAAEGGHLACLEYVFAHNAISTDVACYAALYGHLACLASAYEHGAPLFTVEWSAADVAASFGHLDCMVFAYEHGAPWQNGEPSRNACSLAAHNGHLDCLVFAREHGASVSAWTAEVAAQRGHLACMRYALCTATVGFHPHPGLKQIVLYTRARERLRSAIRHLEICFLERRRRKRAAAAVIGDAWLEFCYMPGRVGAARVARLHP